MNQDNLYCSISHHEANLITDICILKDCQHNLRWCCKECKYNSIHDHKQQDQSHLVPHQNLQSILRQNITKLLEFHQEHLNQHKIEELQQYFLQCEKMNIPIYKRDFEQLQNNIKSNQNILLKYLEMIQDCNIFNLESNLLNEIINIQYNQSVYDYLLLYNKLNDNVTLKLGRNKIILNQNYEPKQYIIKKVDKEYGTLQCSSISNNERYLAYGVENFYLKIYDLSSNKLIQEIKVSFPIMSCQFSSDSQYLYVGAFELVIVYHVTKRFKRIFSSWLNLYSIQKIILLKNQQIITCGIMNIIKTDLKSRKKVFVLNQESDYIAALDYNDEIIAVGYISGSIMFWDCRKMAIILNKSYHKYSLSQIQIISSGTQILTFDIIQNLAKYQIDLMNKDIIKIQSYDFGNICSFQQVNQRQNLLIICENSFLILNNNGDVLEKVNHLQYLKKSRQDQVKYQYESNQLDNLKYVILRQNYSIFLAIAQG